MSCSDISLNVKDRLPEGILDADAKQLHEFISTPTLFNLQGSSEEVLFVSVLLHGNETTGWDAVREVLKKYQGAKLPRSMSLFVGNIAAAKENLRVLPGQPDYNRIWKLQDENPETELARQVLEIVSRQKLFAAIDIHNNTGLNPHYACVNRLDREFLHLATLFSRTVVYFLKPDSVMSRAMAKYCPAVTVECGKAEDSHGVLHAVEYIEACLHLEHFPGHEVSERDIDLFHTVATVRIPDDISFGFDEDEMDINFVADIEKMNFCELTTDITLGQVNCAKSPCLTAINEQGENVAHHYFRNDNGQLKLSVPLMPSMLTMNKDIIRQDCFCYLMERLGHHSLTHNE